MNNENPIIAQLLTDFPAPSYDNDAKPENFEWLRNAALYQGGCQVLHALDLLSCALPRSQKSPLGVVNNHTLFSWGVKDFMKRRADSGTWISVLQRFQSPEALLAQKRHADLHELVNYLKIVVQYDLQGIEESTLDLKSHLTKTLAYTKIFRKLRQDYKRNQKQWNKLVLTGHAVKFYGRVRQAIVGMESDQAARQDLWHTLEQSYRSKHLNDAIDQGGDLSSQQAMAVSSEINRYKKLIQREQLAISCIMGVHNFETEGYRQRLETLNADYDRQMEELNDRNGFLKMVMDKQADLMQFYEEAKLAFRKSLTRIQQEELEREQRELDKPPPAKKQGKYKKRRSKSPKTTKRKNFKN